MNILAINPGATSTKFALFDNAEVRIKETVLHSDKELRGYSNVYEQYNFRMQAIVNILEQNGALIKELGAVVGRGGMLKPLAGGVYQINEGMLYDLKHSKYSEHASNLGAVIAWKIAKKAGVKAYVVNPVSVDEMENVARISGIRDIPRVSMSHALNSKAVAYSVSDKLGVSYNDCNYVVAHLGSGVSVTAHKNGRMIDVNNAQEEGPFSSNRSGGLPSRSLVRLCYSGRYTEKEMLKKLSGEGGMVDYLGTNCGKEIEKMIKSGNEEAILIVKAMAYQVAKEIGSMATVLCGKVDRIIITGGFAYFSLLVDDITTRVKYIAPIELLPGEKELEALVQGVLRVEHGQETAKNYT